MNPDVQRLIDALTDCPGVPLTKAEIQSVCDLIYRIGKNDGALEITNRMLTGAEKREAERAKQ